MWHGWLKDEDDLRHCLQSMKQAGIGGALVMYFQQESDEVAKQMGPLMITEAEKLRVQINIHQAPGWCGSGGPWIRPEQAQQRLVWSELKLTGGKRFEGELPRPQYEVPRRRHPLEDADWLREVAVLAFPAAKKEKAVVQQAKLGAMDYVSRYPPRYVAPRARYPELPADCIVPRTGIVDLSARYRDGRLSWDVPDGAWIVLRLATAPVGLGPVMAREQGFDCDKMDKQAVEHHFGSFLGKLIAASGPAAGKTLVSTHVDSWESGMQNWTLRMREQFRRRRGYDPVPLLPAVAGYAVESLEITQRFLWDLRQTVSELVADYYAGHLRELANKHGMRLSIESYEGPLEDLIFGGRADEPMCEFWGVKPLPPGGGLPSGGHVPRGARLQASSAHVYGKTVVGAESFTDGPTWDMHPARFRRATVAAMCEGVNRFVFHRFCLTKAGRPLGHPPFGHGVYHDGQQTWWSWSKPFHESLARSQWMLRQGLFVADYCRILPEAHPGSPRDALVPPVQGYNYDCAPAEVVLTRMQVKKGRVVLPDGMSYRLLVLHKTPTMTPALLTKLRDLVKDGAVLLGDPPIASPSLSNYPACDQQVQALARELWGADPEKTEQDREVGKGRVLRGMTPEQALARLGVQPDVASDGGDAIRWIHRRSDAMDLYLVGNTGETDLRSSCAFRITGRQPELWWPGSGRCQTAAIWKRRTDTTQLPLQLRSGESVFVVFRRPAVADPIASLDHDGTTILKPDARAARADDVDLVILDNGGLQLSARKHGRFEACSQAGRRYAVTVARQPDPVAITGPWEVRFQLGWGAPEQATFNRLISWHEHADIGIRYFSGHATYTTEVRMDKALLADHRRWILDLGNIGVIAEVSVNDHPTGILWKKPFELDVTEALRGGENRLQVTVVNTWVNRIVGDRLGKRKEGEELFIHGSALGGKKTGYGRGLDPDQGLVESGLIGPVRLVPEARLRLAVE
jgi:hypothetical protein